MATTHTVVKGDTLWGIAAKYLGSGSKYTQLAAINNISNPNLIYVGQVIKLTNDSSSSGGSSSGGSSSGGSSSSSKSTSASKPTIKQFGLQSDADNVLFATWDWNKSNTASYKAVWTYDTGDNVWFVGSDSTITVDKNAPDLAKQSTYSIPTNAKRVQFKVKPISKSTTKNNTETFLWTASWSDVKTYKDSTPLATPDVPDLSIEKYKLLAELDGLPDNVTHVYFQFFKNDAPTVYKSSIGLKVNTGYVSCSCNVEAGGKYKVRCRSYNVNTKEYSEWTAYSANVTTIPATPKGFTTCKALSETSVYFEWDAVETADTYDIQYSTEQRRLLNGSNDVQSVSGIKTTTYDLTGLEMGEEYFFRLRAVNEKGETDWSEISSITIGKDPAAPTTWSSTTTAITGEDLTLYWVHNSEDGSSQTYAELELYVDGNLQTHTIQNSEDEDEKDKTSFYKLDTSSYIEGTKIEWRVRTAGVTKSYGDWSIQRTIDIYAPPTLELNVTDSKGNAIETLTSFPLYISGLAGPKTQAPIGYYLEIVSNEIYETVDNVGNSKTVNSGDRVYYKYFDITTPLTVELSAGDVNLDSNITYTVKCVASMNSGLSAEASSEFVVAWEDKFYIPNAEIGLDEDTLTVSITPYCESGNLVTHRVSYTSYKYVVTDEILESVWGEVVPNATTETGEIVYYGVTADGEAIYYCQIEEKTIVTDVLMSVYRREFDGSFKLLAEDLDGAKNTTIVDPHPALDFARYRIVAISKDTGSVSFYDLPGYPVGGKAVVIQWDEAWSNFETSEEAALEQPAWAGSMLKLPYNVDVSDNNSPDVALVKYIGRSNPVTYYGTQIGSSASWKVDIVKSDKETLYGLRRLQHWMGDVYVREPSGSGYWANVNVSFSQKHCELTIPVTLDIVRVEGGI